MMSTPLFAVRCSSMGSCTLALLLLATPARILAQPPLAALQSRADLLRLPMAGTGPDRFVVAFAAPPPPVGVFASREPAPGARLSPARHLSGDAPARLLEQAERATHAPAQFAVIQRPTGRLMAGGLAGGAVGAVAGGLLAGGVRALGPCDDQDGCLDRYADWAVSGALLGQSLVLPIGVHLANDRQGRVPPPLLASAGIGTAGLLTYWAIQRHRTYDEGGNPRGNPDAFTAVTVMAMPVLELVTTIAIERATARRRGNR
jgi:hypothetical protein